ncbi:MAG TPA: alpha/beta fold hydrolase, partial [Saliniramus sp.]|nr:alpha/beta fold hydrolase [Saliniramus sp.]
FLTRQTAAAVAAACRALAGTADLPDAEALISRHGVKERYRDWLTRTLALVRSEGGAQVAPQSIHDLPEPGHFALGAAELDLLDRTIAHLGDILTETQHSADIYLSASTPEVYGHLFERPNRLIATIVAELTKKRPLRILEVGGGLGTTLSRLREVVAASGSHYRFTDASTGMLSMARKRFGTPDWLSFGVLDANAVPESDAEGFDVIVATSVLHVAQDAAQALAGLRRRLRPGGILLAFEQTRFFPWYDLGMGLQSGFDARTDRARRPDHPLLERGDWAALLAEAGFADVEIPLAEGSLDDRLGFDVIMARAPDGGSGASLEPEALRQWLSGRLPGYMVPRHVALIDRLPLSVNGKIDRTALRPPVAGGEGGAGRADGSLLAEVSKLVASCLGVEQVDPGKSLFELGATSLSIVAIQRRIGELYGRSVPLQAIFEQPTMDQLVSMISGDAAPTSAVIRFASARPGDARPRLIMMPGILALPFYLRELARIIEPEIDLLSIQLPGLFADEAPLDTIEDQVDYVVSRIRQAQPRGPYVLGGHSYGGTVAFEAARRLRLAGEDVPLVVLVDTVRTRSRLEDFQNDDIAYIAMVRALTALYGDRLDADFGGIPGEKSGEQDTKAAFDRLTAELTETRIFGPIALPIERMAAMFKANFRALGQFEAKPLPGDLALIRTEEGFPVEFADYEPEATLADPALGWGEVVDGEIALSSVPGDHLSLMAPGTLGPTAEIILDLMRKAVGGEGAKAV